MQNNSDNLIQVNSDNKEAYYLKDDTKTYEAIECESANDAKTDYASVDVTLKALEAVFNDDPKLYIKLKFYALRSIRLYFKKDILGDFTAEDIVNIVIEKIISGTRKWHPAKTPNIVQLILMAIVSDVRNAYKKRKNIITGIDLYNSNGELIEANITDLQRAYVREDLNDDNFRDQLEDMISKVYKAVENDVYATFVLDELLETDHSLVKKPVPVIAEKLKIPELEVKNAIRRIERKTRKIIS